MRLSTILLGPLAFSAYAFPAERRQIGGLLGALMSSQKTIKTEKDFKPTVPREGVKRVRYWYGPYTIRPLNSTKKTGNSFSMDPGGTAWNYLGEDLPKDVTILMANASVVYEDGTVIDVNTGLYNHHLLLIDLSKTAPTIAQCPNGKGVQPPGMSMFAGSSEDKGGAFFTTTDGQFNSGYYVGKNDKIIMNGDIVNYTNETKTVYSLIDVQYVEGKPAGNMEAVTQLWSVGQCDGQIGFVKPPPGQKKFALKSQTMNITQDGTFLAFRGHLHDGGMSLSATLNGKVICDSKAIYGGISTNAGDQGTISAMQYCTSPIKVKKGDVMTLEANYDLDLHPPRMQHGGGMAEEMALMSIFFATDNPKK